MVSIGSSCFVNLEDASTGALFAQAPYEPNSNAVESVSDSSRYFVLRVVDRDSGQHASIGLGFEERGDAFDFRVALQDFHRLISGEKAAEPAEEGSKIDFSLKEGQTIKINVGSSQTRASFSWEKCLILAFYSSLERRGSHQLQHNLPHQLRVRYHRHLNLPTLIRFQPHYQRTILLLLSQQD